MAFLLVPEEAGQAQHSPTAVTSVIPPMMFATFSRPPPAAYAVIVKVDMEDPGSGDEQSPMDDQLQGPSPIVPEREGNRLASSKETKARRQGDIIAADDPFKPPPLPI